MAVEIVQPLLLCLTGLVRRSFTSGLTIGLRKVGGAWKVAHEHHSFPAES